MSRYVPANTPIYQFKITIRYSEPPIWRQIQIPSCATFDDLHRAIQRSMGWKDYHLHAFRMKNPVTQHSDLIGPPSTVDNYHGSLDGNELVLAQYFSTVNEEGGYLYDFCGSQCGWLHTILLEDILNSDDGLYPRCIAGQRACPPEDCGGILSGYDKLIEILKDPNHRRYKEKKEWIEAQGLPNYENGILDTEKFNLEDVKF